jgi:hypothetical protein
LATRKLENNFLLANFFKNFPGKELLGQLGISCGAFVV